MSQVAVSMSEWPCCLCEGGNKGVFVTDFSDFTFFGLV
jgi:hypothetical protein